MSHSPTEGYTLEQVTTALNSAVSLIIGDTGLYPPGTGSTLRDRALANMVCAAVRSLLQNPEMSLDDVIAENWPKYAATTVRRWVK